jgi:imidazole glycerol-phosphate synthase subunit HisF
MKRIRVIPVLLIKDNGLVKSIKFKKHQYVGDPINTVKIFNDKEVDELAIIDITATAEKRIPDYKRITQLAGEAFMPLCYGGGISDITQVQQILYGGIEKVMLNNAAFENPQLISQIAGKFGNQSVVVSIDVKKNTWGKNRVYTKNASFNTQLDPVAFAKQCEDNGAGELMVNSVERDGTYQGYDIELLKQLSSAVSIPVVACGGASDISDFKNAINIGGASAVAAGSMFVFQRPHNAVLISYPSQQQLVSGLYNFL